MFDDKAKLSPKLNCFKDLTQLSFDGTNIDNLQGLEGLEKLGSIGMRAVKYSKFPSTFKTIYVSHLGVYHTVMSALPLEFCGMTGLKVLELEGTNIENTLPNCLDNLKSLENLSISGSPKLTLRQLNVKTLEKMTGLKRLNLNNTGISDADIQTLQKALPHVLIN